MTRTNLSTQQFCTGTSSSSRRRNAQRRNAMSFVLELDTNELHVVVAGKRERIRVQSSKRKIHPCNTLDEFSTKSMKKDTIRASTTPL